MDIDVSEEDLKPLVLYGTRRGAVVHEAGQVDSVLIRQSAMLTASRWNDAKESKLVLDVDDRVLTILIRFGNLVAKHNSKGDQKHVLPQTKNLPSKRLAQLPYVIGHSVALGTFLDQVSTRPHVLLQCAQAAEKMLWEPAQTAFLLKFGAFLHGMSLPFMELVWVHAKETDAADVLETLSARSDSSERPLPPLWRTSKTVKKVKSASSPTSRASSSPTSRAPSFVADGLEGSRNGQTLFSNAQSFMQGQFLF